MKRLILIPILLSLHSACSETPTRVEGTLLGATLPPAIFVRQVGLFNPCERSEGSTSTYSQGVKIDIDGLLVVKQSEVITATSLGLPLDPEHPFNIGTIPTPFSLSLSGDGVLYPLECDAPPDFTSSAPVPQHVVFQLNDSEYCVSTPGRLGECDEVGPLNRWLSVFQISE